MIFENGTVRTLDPSLPTAGALAIAGDRIAGGVGTHETALASPDVIDLGGRCVLPGFTDSHVHFPTWAAARNVIRLEDTTSAEDAAARMAPGVPGTAADHWFRAQGFRETNWPALPTKEVLDAVTGDTPAAVISKDFHAIWLNSAGIARTGGDLRKYDVPGGVEGPEASMAPDGFDRLKAALGLDSASEGDSVQADLAGAGTIDGVVDYLRGSFAGIRTADALYRFFGRNAFGGAVGLQVHHFGDVDADATKQALKRWLDGVYA